MKFTSDDRVTLLKCYGAQDGDEASTKRAVMQLEEDICQLAAAAAVTTYELCDADGREVIRKISKTEAIRRLGREGWLAGLVRSAFHMSAMRQTVDNKNYVGFNSRRLFK